MNVSTHQSKPYRSLFSASVIVTMMCALIGSVEAVQLYQWKDEKGVMQYTDKPPVGKAATKLKVRGPATMGDAAAAADDKQTAGDAAAAPKDSDKQRCEEERKRLNVLQNSAAVSIRNADGTSRELSKEDMSVETEMSKLAISRYCK